MPQMKDQWAIFLALIALLPVRFAFFRLRSPIKILIFAWKNVYFLFMSPIHKTTTSITLANLWKFQILLRICIKNVICEMHFRYFFCSDAFRFHNFAKMCSPLKPETHFWKTTLSNQSSKTHFYGALNAQMEDPWAIFFAFIALLALRLAFFRLQSPIRILIFAWKNVYFLFMSPPGNLRLTLIVLSNVFSMTFSSFRIDLCIILWKMLPDFANFMKMCSPPSVGSTFSKNDFCQYRVQDHVSIPKLAPKSPLFGGHFHHVLFKKW